MTGFLSIGIPARNEEESIEEAIISITKSSAWHSAGKHKELIVCINDSHDKTEALCRELSKKIPELHIITTAQRGKAHALNLITHASSPHAENIYFSDADVILKKDTIAKTVHALHTTPTAAFAAPLAVPMAGYIPPKNRTMTQALQVEAMRIVNKNGYAHLWGMGFAANRAFLLSNPIPAHHAIGDDIFIRLKHPEKIIIVRDAQVTFKTARLIDHFRQRVRAKIQKQQLLKDYPELIAEAQRRDRKLNPRRLDAFLALSTKAKAGLLVNQAIELAATIRAQQKVAEVWKKTPSTKLKHRH